MTRQVVFRPEAEGEVLATRAWYEARRSGLGKEFAQAVNEMVSRIVEAPMAYQLAHADTRAATRVSLAVAFIGFTHGERTDTRSNLRWSRRAPRPC